MIWVDNLASGRKLRHGQNENGMHFGEIIDHKGEVVAATTGKTASDIARWLKEQDDAIITWAQQNSYDQCERVVEDRLSETKGDQS